MNFAWSCLNFFEGRWKGDDGSEIKVVPKKGSLCAALRYGDNDSVTLLSIRFDEWGRWRCGDGIFQVPYSFRDQNRIC